jgi:acetyl esterase/lipase
MKILLPILLGACAFAQDPPRIPDWVKVAKKRPGMLVIHGGFAGGNLSPMVDMTLETANPGKLAKLKDLPPILTLHCDAGPTVPYEHDVKLTNALVGAGARAEIITVPQGKHGFPKDKLDELYPQIITFLEKYGIK